MKIETGQGKRWLILFSILLCLVLLGSTIASCGGAKPTEQIAPTGSATPSKPTWLPNTFVVGSGGMGTVEYACSCAIAPIFEKYLGTKARSIPMEITREIFAGLRGDSVQITRTFSNPTVEGRDVWAARTEGPQRVRTIWFWYDLPCGVGARADDTSIMTIKDIKGKRVPLAVYSPSEQELINAIIAYTGYSKDDFIWVPFGSWTSECKALGEGKVDFGRAIPEGASTSEVAAMPHGLKWVDLPLEDKAAWKRFSDTFPEVYPRIMPDNFGLQQAWGHAGWSSPLGWYVKYNQNEEFVYQMTKALGDHYNEYKDLHIRFRTSSIDYQRQWLDMTPVPVHPGAIRYLKEKGVWKPEDDNWNNDLIAKEESYQEAWQAALDEADAKQIKVDTSNDAWMKLWDSYRSKLPRMNVRF